MWSWAFSRKHWPTVQLLWCYFLLLIKQAFAQLYAAQVWPLLTSLWHGLVSIFRFTWASPCREEGAGTARRSISMPTSSTCSYRVWVLCWQMYRMWCSSESASFVIVAHPGVCTLSESASSVIVASCSVCSLKTHSETPQMTLGTPWVALMFDLSGHPYLPND